MIAFLIVMAVIAIIVVALMRTSVQKDAASMEHQVKDKIDHAIKSAEDKLP